MHCLQEKCIQLIRLKIIKKSVWTYLFVNGTEIYKFKGKDSEIVAYPLCPGKVSKDWTVDDMEKTGLNGHV